MHTRRKDSSTATQRCVVGSPWGVALRQVIAISLAAIILTTAGCGGCRSQKTPLTAAEEAEAAAKKEQELAAKKKKDPREIKPLLPLLGQEPPPEIEGVEPTEGAGPRLLVKPGHWTTTVQEMKSNYDDFVGNSATTLVDAKENPAPLDHTNFTFQSTRPVALAKGRAKRIEGELFIPEQSAGVRVRSTLKNRNTGAFESAGQPVLQKMPSYQYFLVVLSKEISQYGFLKVTDAVRMPWEEEFDAVSQAHYRVVLADANKRLPLPSNTLTWSSVAHIVWDEVDPTRLTPEQQLALVDWIHWGGRLVINGPDSLDSLRGSFLADYLPAESTDTRTFAAIDLKGWSDYWSRRDRGQDTPTLKPTKPWSGLRLKPLGNATELAGGAGLFYECAVGRGTVVVSAIQLAERDLINWPGYDSFLNAALLRRPRRIFSEGPYGGARVGWADFAEQRLDAHFSTGLRLFARDAKTKANQWNVEETSQDFYGQDNSTTTTNIDRIGGLGTWSEFNPVSEAARTVLTDAAAVRVPGAGFVIGAVAIYLFVLVPFNWMIFRTLNRVEWAWIAAPIIALLGTLVIVRQAQLDIGFVRSQTEVALLELQDHHPRGLLSRFTALYSSLSTTYDVEFENSAALATPFPASSQPKAVKEQIWNVVFEKQNKTKLSGLAVSSASTKMVHSEEMFSFDGPLRLGESSRGHKQLENRLGYDLRDVVVVRRYFDSGTRPRYEGSWIGDIRSGETTVLGLQSMSPLQDELPFPVERELAAGTRKTDAIDVEGLMRVALEFPDNEDPLASQRDEYRVVGLIDRVLPGTEVAPAASQIVGATVVLAHFEFGNLPAAEPDVNSPDDVLKSKPTTP